MKRTVVTAIALAAVAATAIVLGGSAVAGQNSQVIKKTYSTADSAAIPEDGGTAGLELPTVNVSQRGKIKDVDVKLRGFDDAIGSVELTLLPPRGPDVKVFKIDAVNVQSNIGSGDFSCAGSLVTLNDNASASILEEDGDAAGAYKPASPLSALKNRSANGKWRLLLEKAATNNDGGSIGCFQLKIKTKT
jgi:subtilisin-like proprotein convertase family protein